jgi:prepilin-type N-terminal cleavage/methylation domain-containing protein
MKRLLSFQGNGRRGAKKAAGFTPLEKAAAFKRRSSPIEANGCIKLSVRTVRERSSLTGPVREKFSNRAGFTLVEVVFALAILAVTLSGLLLTYVSMFVLTDMQRDHALASNSVMARLEEVQSMDFDNISAAAGTFNLSDYGFPANQSSRGRTEVVASFSGYPATLTRVRIVASYATRLNRTIGEDINFNGVMDAGEDVNNNSRLDSSVEVVSLLAK